MPPRSPRPVSRPRAPAPAQPSRVALRSRSRRLRRRVRDHPPSPSVNPCVGGHEPRERSTQQAKRAGAGAHSRRTRDGGSNDLFRKETKLATETFSNREGRGRRARRDRGSFQVSERDQELLGLVAEQYAVTLDQLARLIGRTHRTARGLRDRWCNAGWTRSAKLAVNLPPFVWLTSRGSRVAQSPFRTWKPNQGLASHIEAVTNVRLMLERELHLGIWDCERVMAQSFHAGYEARTHLPDG